jgi:toluene monooxygenase system protein E
MSELQPTLTPLRTWSHLASRRKRPSEYEIVSTNLHYTTDNKDAPFELDPDYDLAQWYKRYRNESALRFDDWNAFRDPDELVYRTYNILQDGQETYISGVFDQFSERGHDALLDRTWAGTLARLYTPARYLFHGLQLASAYLTQIAPASTISNSAAYQTADSLRWLSHTAYRTAELARTFPEIGFGKTECNYVETDPAWQGFREFVEKALIAWDWGESFVVLNLVLKPAVEESVLRGLGHIGRQNGDTLLGMLTDNQLLDAARHRRWAGALVRLALENEANRPVITQWIAHWQAYAERAIDTYIGAFVDQDEVAKAAKTAVGDFHRSLGL